MSERERSSRFSVYVPTPKVRLNMGLPIYKSEDGSSAFGYTGMSLQSDRHLFIDVNKVALYQSGSHSMWQVGGKWLQYSNANMVMASTANNMVAASNKVVIAAGAGHGQITALDHALPHVTPRMVDYNNLDLHYRVEEVHNGVKQLMYGKDWQDEQKKSQSAQLNLYSSKYASDGLLEKLRKQFSDLGSSPEQARRALQPVEWEGNYVEMKNGLVPGGDSSVYTAFKPFDPYPAAGFRLPGAARTFGIFLQTVNFFHRFVDVLGKVGPAITDNFIGSRIQNLVNIWGNAQEGFQAALNVGDLARWEQGTDNTGPSAFEDELGNFTARPQNAENFGDSGPSLVSKPEMYDLTGLSGSDLDVEVYDSTGNHKTLTLASGDVAAPSATLDPPNKHLQVTVSFTTANIDASLKLDGTRVLYTAGAWGALPDGFERTGNVFKKSDGSFFTVTSRINCTVVSGGSGSIEIEVDGTTYTIDVAALAAAHGSRAANLASQISAVGTRSGAQVVVASQTTGTGSTIKIPKSADEAAVSLAKQWLGISARINDVGATQGTAAWLAAQLNSLGMNFTASAGPAEDLGADVVTVTHKNSGNSAYLKFSGGATSRLFNSDPATAKGKSASWYKNFQDARVLQYEMAKWPEDIRNLFRPVVEAFKDVMAVYDRINGIIQETLALAGLAAGPPSSIGMFAGDGITMGTAGKWFAAANGITLIASPPGELDDRKFVFGLESLLKGMLEWDPRKAYYKDRDEGYPFNVPKKPGHKTGGIRILSSDDVFIASQTDTRIMALGTASVDGTSVNLTATQTMRVAVRDGYLSLRGTTIVVGYDKDNGKQLATKALGLIAADKVELKTTAAALVADNDKIHVGGRGPHVFTGKLDKPRLYISTKGGSEAAQLGTGDNNGEIAHGFRIKSDGKPEMVGKSELTLSAGGSGVTVKGAGVEVMGQFKVGPEFVVKSTGKMAPETVVKSVLMEHPRAMQLPGLYTALMAQAKAQRVVVDLAATALENAERSQATMFSPFARAAADEGIRMLSETFVEAKANLADFYFEWRRLIAEGALYGLDEAGLGVTDPDDLDVFFEE